MRRYHRFWRSDASSLVEFAIALPLLMVVVVGIFDFGGAFNTKQELNNAVREGARLGASQPTNDLLNPVPVPSVDAIRALVDSYLLASRINDCGLSTATQVASSPLKWTYIVPNTSAGNTCGGTMTLTIIRGYPSCDFAASNFGSPLITVNVACTQVAITYPYKWNFNSVIQLLVPGANYGTAAQIQTNATAVNMD
jgi:Flp pilus assembly protein TadG